MSAVTTTIAVVGAVLGGGGTVAIVNAFARKKLTKADVADRLSDSALKWVNEFQAEATEARREAADMRQEAASARREASEARAEWHQMRLVMQREMQQLVEQIHRVRIAVWSPNATIEQVRAVINGVTADNEPPP